MKIYCKNTDCKLNHPLSEPVPFKPTEAYKPFPDDFYSGECIGCPMIVGEEFRNDAFVYYQSICTEKDGFCGQKDCLMNSGLKCTRDKVFISKSLVSGKWVCKCFSQRKFKGHRDWFANLKSDGTPKGGHISDEDSEKIDRDNKVSKSFADHTRQKQEVAKKPLLPPQRK